MNASTNQFPKSVVSHPPATDTAAAPLSVPTDGRGAPFHLPADPCADPVTVSLVGVPQGKGRARAFLRGGHIGHYTPEKTRTYEGMIRSAAMDEIGNKPLFDCPVEFVLRAIFPVPTSWSGKKRQLALTGGIKPGKKPDLDNIAKAWNDGLNSVVYRDDALICRMTLDKRYGPQALVVVTVRPLP
jgi:Holliday junction resolvase RusA-like endonuclease